MKPILNKIAIIAGLSLLASCQSFFDEDPVYSTTTDTFFNSETALETYAIGFLESHLPSAATLTRGDQYSDICVTTQTEGFLKTGGYSAQQANNWARGNWRPLYNVNYYLKHMKDAAPYVDDATMKHYEGVGRFWRAWFYWDKVKTFGDVPWYDEPIDPDDDEQLYKGRDPRDYVMQKVLEDLDFAATWCSKASKYVNTNVINRYVALALKSRICLYEGTWRKYHGLDGSEEWLRACVAASEELMGDSPYSLVSTAGEETTNYSKVFKSEEPQYTEVILANEFNATLNRFHDASWYYASGSYGQRNSGPKAFVNMYLNLDGTRFTDKDGYNKTQFKDEFAGRDYPGSSGCGKTTALKLINGLLIPDEGTIRSDGTDIQTMDQNVLRRNIGYAIQGSVLFPHMSVEQNIAYVPSLLNRRDRQRTRDAVDKWMKIVHLPQELKDRYPWELSGGQQQRVGIARALAASPHILLMDEPFGAVDSITRTQLQKEIKAIHEDSGITIVFVTHDINEALYLGTRVLVMDQGAIQQYDTPDQIRSRPATDFVRQLISGQQAAG